MRAIATLITGLGDAALLLPAAVVLLIYLLRARSWRAAAAWAAAITLCAGLTVAAKMMFHACGGQYQVLGIYSPSGHTSLSATFYGCAALMLSADQSWGRRLGVLLAAAALVVAIAASRIALHAHTVDEVAAGLAIGLLCVALYASAYLPRAVGGLGWQLPVAVIIVLALLTHGRHLSIEGFLDRLTDRLQLAQYVCPLREDPALKTVASDIHPGR
ncbi:MAG: phosphatase PAP2 family protein [Stellaceae bacterium]